MNNIPLIPKGIDHNREIERKFLVIASKLPDLTNNKYSVVEQAYLSTDPVVRVRICHNYQNTELINSESNITIKGQGTISRDEFIFDIDLGKAMKLASLSKYNIIRKKRTYIPYEQDESLKWELDTFYGLHNGMMLVEIEIPDTTYELILPEWVGEEVTFDEKYQNQNIASSGI